MMRKLNSAKGQIALVMILLTAAALIFLSITLNWGRLASTKTMLTVAADQAAAMLASDAASYGEMEKQTNLQDTNQVSALSAVLMDIIMVVVAIIILIIACVTYGAGAALYGVVAAALLVVMAIVTLVLEITVIQPGMEALWNKLQLSQPIQQQFFEGGLGQALQGVITDQVSVTDYFDSNANGHFGFTGSSTPNDVVPRFGLFYTDRLKMLNQGVRPEIAFFYNQLSEFMNGQTCAQNYADSGYPVGNQSATGVPLNPSCLDPITKNDYCYVVGSSGIISKDPACTQKITNLITCAQNAYEKVVDPSIPLNANCPGSNLSNPDQNNCVLAPSGSATNSADPSCQRLVFNAFSFQLNDPCTDSTYEPGSSVPYSPYCDACCQPWAVSNTGINMIKEKQTHTLLRPTSCPAPSRSDPTVDCVEGSLTFNSTDPACAPASGQCQDATYNPYPGFYPYLYDASFQEYANGKSFLDQYGRDEQFPDNPSALPTLFGGTVSDPFLKVLDPQGAFPNGIYPFFYLMLDYSPEVDNIDPTAVNLTTAQQHWCVAGAAMKTGNVPAFTAPKGYADLNQLTLTGYSCKDRDCCVNFLPDSFTASPAQASAVLTITVGSGVLPTVNLTSPSGVNLTANGSDMLTISGTAFEASPGSIASVSLEMTLPDGSKSTVDTEDFTYSPDLNTIGATITFGDSNKLDSCQSYTSGGVTVSSATQAGTYKLTATATDNAQPAVTSAPSSVTFHIDNPGACLANSCGVDACNKPCSTSCGGANPICCKTGQTCNSPTSINAISGTCESPPCIGTCVACSASPACASGDNCGTNSCGKACTGAACTGTGPCVPDDGIAGDPGKC